MVSISISNKNIENLLTKEWLLTNVRGSFASSTIIGCNTRRYHGLLVGSLNLPAKRIMALANCLEMVIPKPATPKPNKRAFGDINNWQKDGPGKIFNLSTFEFSDKFAPQGFNYLKRFYQDIGVHFDYELDKLALTKSVYLLRHTDTVALVYDFTTVKRKVEFVLRPFIGLRDFHTLQKSYASLCSAKFDNSLFIYHNVTGGCELLLNCQSMGFEKDEQWWFNFVYRNDRERGQDFTEDLWTPGFFKCCIDSPTRIVFWAHLRNQCEPEQLINTDIDAACEELHRHQESIKYRIKGLKYNRRNRALCFAADQFVVTCATSHGPRVTILAGFPWFADWGRDTFIALPGLLLSTGSFDEAKSVLTSFAAMADEGMIPNRFDSYGRSYFDSIDASLWFINAAFQYLKTTGDTKTFTQQLLPTIRWIIDCYHNGTRFGICADDDGLITIGDGEIQLTWMVAKYDGVAFIPRYGKAVEVNALWYNTLCLITQFYTHRDVENANYYKSMADKVAASFCKLFWNEAVGYLNDCILPSGLVDACLRPNQIFAVSLPFSPLPACQQASVVDAVQKNLLTPYGLRTLNVQDSRYKGKYTGTQQQRDEAYYQGTVWPYLIGPFVEAYLKVHGFSRKSKRQAAKFIQPLMRHLAEDGCLGQIGEIFDGDAPHKPRGCIASACSVAELIRAYQLINS